MILYLSNIVTCDFFHKGCWGHGIFKSIKEVACGNSRGKLKKKTNFEGWS